MGRFKRAQYKEGATTDKTRLPLIPLTICLSVLSGAACDLPDAAEEFERPTESHEDELRQAKPAKDNKLPAALKPERIGGVAGICGVRQQMPMAEIRYRATRNHRSDLVVLTFLREGAHLSIGHRRNGKDLGTIQVNTITMEVLGRDTFLKRGQELHSAYLLAEMTSTGVMARIPDALRCIGDAPPGEMSPDGKTYLSYGFCEFGWDALAVATAVVVSTAQVACCSTAGPATLGAACVGCVATGEALKVTAGILTGVGRSDCDQSDPRDERIKMLEEQNKRLEEQMRQNDEWIQQQIKKRLDEEDKKAYEDFLKAQQEEEERLRNEASRS